MRDAHLDDSVASVLDLAGGVNPQNTAKGARDEHRARNHTEIAPNGPTRGQSRQDGIPAPGTSDAPTTKNPARSLRTERGSYVTHLAEGVGFEPT